MVSDTSWSSSSHPISPRHLPLPLPLHLHRGARSARRCCAESSSSPRPTRRGARGAGVVVRRRYTRYTAGGGLASWFGVRGHFHQRSHPRSHDQLYVTPDSIILIPFPSNPGSWTKPPLWRKSPSKDRSWWSGRLGCDRPGCFPDRPGGPLESCVDHPTVHARTRLGEISSRAF